MKNIETHFTTWKKKNLFHSLFHQQVHSRHYLQLRTQLIEFVKGGVLTSKGKSNWIEEKKKNEKNIHSQNPEKSQARSHVHCITQENLSLPNTHSQTHSLATVRKTHKKKKPNNPKLQIGWQPTTTTRSANHQPNCSHRIVCEGRDLEGMRERMRALRERYGGEKKTQNEWFLVKMAKYHHFIKFVAKNTVSELNGRGVNSG